MGETPTTTRRRLRFGLRTLLIATALIALVMGWVARARQQRDAVAALRAANPSASHLYHYQTVEGGQGLELIGYARLRRWLGVAYFSSVASIELHYATDPDLCWVGRFPKLTELFLRRSVDVTDEGIGQLRSLTNLKKLVLSDASNVGDGGLKYLAEMTSLEQLSCSAGPRVTRAGILQLAKLTRLKRLELACQNAEATAAVDELRRILPDCSIRGTSADDVL